MSVTVPQVSFMTAARSWLTSETMLEKAKDKKANSFIKFIGKQSKATNISAVTLFAHLLSYIPKIRERDNIFIRIFRWATGIIGIALPFINLARDNKNSNTQAKPILDINATDLKSELLQALREPANSLQAGSLSQGIFPDFGESVDKKMKIYSALNELAGDPSDPLFLNTEKDKISSEKRDRALALRKKIISIYQAEQIILFSDEYQTSSREVVNLLENIIINSSELSLGEALSISNQTPDKVHFKDQSGRYLWECSDTNYKKVKYKALEEFSYRENDPFGLNKKQLNDNQVEFRAFLLQAYKEERALLDQNDSKASKEAVDSLHRILSRAKANPREEWDNEYAKKQFTQRISSIPNIINPNLIFESLSIEERDNIAPIIDAANQNDLSSFSKWKSLESAIEHISPEDISRSTLPQNRRQAKISFYTVLLHEIVSKHGCRDEAKKIITDKLLPVVHDQTTFGNIKRDNAFFKNPKEYGTPGLALKTIRDINFCFDNGYCDTYELQGRITEEAIKIINGQAVRTNLFILSGKPGTGKSSFPIALANQLGMKLIDISPISNIQALIEQAIDDEPCIIKIDEVDGMLQPRSDNCQHFNKLKGKRVLVIMTTNSPGKSFDINKINENGESESGCELLSSEIDKSIIESSNILFSFFRMPNEEQGEKLARHFLTPYIEQEKLGEIDFRNIGKIIKNYSPSSIQTVCELCNNHGHFLVEDFTNTLTQTRVPLFT